MKAKKAKKELRLMLESLTQGSILPLLSEVFEELAEVARKDGDETRVEQCRMVAVTLFVVGLGIDAACPR